MAGAGYKLFNTGDVLTAAQVNTYLMEQTVMVFANAAARTTALSGVVSEGMISYLKDTNAVEVYDGSNWVSSDDPNAIQNTIVDAKGDLISASAADVPARLAVGNNGETLIADSSTSTGLRWQGSMAAGRNFAQNGGFDIWQRGTSFSNPASNAYTADRWCTLNGGSATITLSRQATNDTTNLPFIQYCMRYQRNSGQTNTGSLYLTQSLESVNSIPLAGRTVTFSFYARAGANFSGSTLQATVSSGTGTDQNINGGFTGISNFILQYPALTTTWQRFTYSGTVPTNATQLGFYFVYTPSGTAGANDYFEVTGVQLELGSVATAFTRQGGNIAGERSACERYYWRFTGGANFAPYGTGTGVSSTTAEIVVNHPTTMRVSPTSIDFGSLRLGDGVAGTALTNLTLTNAGLQKSLLTATVASGLTQYRPYSLINDNSLNGFLGFNAEL